MEDTPRGGVPVELRGVSKTYDAAESAVVALDRLDLTVGAGEFLTLLGPSGSGKTTALQIVAGLEHLTAGEVWLGEREVGRLDPSKRDIGVVFQNYALFPHLTVADNVGYPLRMRKVDRAERARRIDEVLDLVELRHLANRKPAQLSGGQQQRVAIARALVFRPRLLLMDEPLGALDKRLRDQMQLELRQIQKRVGITCLYVTHDQEEAMFLSDRIAIIDQGRLQQVGTAEEIYHRPANEFVGNFIGRMNLWDGRVVAGDSRGCEIELAGVVRIRSSQPATPGTSVRVATRPEAIRLVADESAAAQCPDAIPVRVSGARFTGSNTLVQATAGTSLDVVVQVDAWPRTDLERAWIVTDPDATYFFTTERDGDST